jgi:glucose uptake protein GlcU
MIALFDQSNDAFGFLAALVGSICYGSYGVPIKATQSVDVHPLVLQTYRTVVVFVASVSIVRLLQEPTAWTPYGLLAGLLEVCGGTAGIVAIRTAGIATAIGTWASVMIVVNFVWGILIFHEPVRSLPGTCGAFVMLGVGLIGMTKFSSPTNTTAKSGIESKPDDLEFVRLVDTTSGKNDTPTNPRKNDASINNEMFDGKAGNGMNFKRLISRKRVEEFREDDDSNKDDDVDDDNQSKESFDSNEANNPSSNDKEERVRWRIIHLGASLTDRQFGIGCAMLNGILGASAMVPLHYAKHQGFSEFSYIFSFVTGVLIANMLLWVLYFTFHCCCQSRTHPFRRDAMRTAFEAMPLWHFRELWFKLLIAGLLLTAGMIGSILSISRLGQAVGNSLIQSKILVSGLWGICCFQEIKDRRAITNWFLSATLSVLSILWLSFERQAVVGEKEIL